MSRLSRRSWLRTCVTSGAMAPFTLPLLGCGASSSPEIARSAVPSIPKEVRLTYRPTSDFAGEVSRAMEAGQTVAVIFDGPDRLAEGAPLLQLLSDRQRIQNHEAFWKTLDALDHPEGRTLLGQAFAAPLLEHQPVTRIDGDHTRANGEVVAPGMILMVLIVGLLTSFTVVATTQIICHGPIIAEWSVETTSKGPVPMMRLWPAMAR